jgi:hypothetical protein
MAAYLVIDAIVERVRSGRIYVNCGHDIVMSVSAANTRVTDGMTFLPGQAVRVEVEGNRILKLETR